MRSKPQSIGEWLAALDLPAADRDYKPGHERVVTLLSRLPLQRPALRIRIAGTNGKGSTAHLLAAALQAAGLKVGLYTSPHIRRFNERIRIDNQPVSDDELLQALECVVPVALENGASYFETATALALYLFAQHDVAVEILEAGVGARLDATTAVPADMALFSPIGLDHQAWLGETVVDVATEKAYAADGCAIVLSALQDPQVAAILRRHAPAIRLIEPDNRLRLAVAGEHQRQNAALALAAVTELQQRRHLDISPAAARLAIEQAHIPGRLQHIRHGKCDIWLDAAHNRHAVEALLPSLPNLANPFDAICLFTREDRNLDDCTALLRPYTRAIVGQGQKHDRRYGNISQALAGECKRDRRSSLLLLGSFTTVEAALRWLESNI